MPNRSRLRRQRLGARYHMFCANMNEIAAVVGTVIAYLGGGAFVVLGFSTWLGKVWANRILNKEVEELRNRYKIIETEHSVRFAALHSRRAEVIAEIYSGLSKVENEARTLVNPVMEPGEPAKSETYRKAASLIANLIETFNIHRIYLTENTCSKVDEFIQQSRLPLGFFEVADQANRQDPEQKDMALQNNLKAKSMELWEIVDEKVPEARRAVEVEFRRVLGVIE